MARRVAFTRAARGRDLDVPKLAVVIEFEPYQLASHQDTAAKRRDLARRRVPHHARSLARILEALDQRLDGVAAAPVVPAGLAAEPQRSLQSVQDRRGEIEAFDA